MATEQPATAVAAVAAVAAVTVSPTDGARPGPSGGSGGSGRSRGARGSAGSAGPTGSAGPGGQTAVPCWFLRGGTSRGPFFRAADLPEDPAARDRVLLAALGSPDPRQIDGLGGATPLTSKAGVVGPSTRPDADLEFLFAQAQPDGDTIDTTANCGNMLAAVVPFALESGLLAPQGETTTARVLTLNTSMVAEITVRTPEGPSGRYVAYAGDTRIDGVPGTASPVTIGFLDTAGSVCRSLLPTGNTRDRVTADGVGTVDVTCIDNGMPLVLVAAADLGRTGYESVAELNADTELKRRLEALRLVCGELMGLGDVGDRNYPKMTLIAPPAHGGTLTTRSFIPHVCHASIGVLAAVTAATACVLDGTVAHRTARLPAADTAGPGGEHTAGPGAEHTAGPSAEHTAEHTAGAGADAPTDLTVSVEHPAGSFAVALGLDRSHGTPRVTKSALVRTARLIMAGEVLVPDAAAPGRARTTEKEPEKDPA